MFFKDFWGHFCLHLIVDRVERQEMWKERGGYDMQQWSLAGIIVIWYAPLLLCFQGSHSLIQVYSQCHGFYSYFTSASTNKMSHHHILYNNKNGHTHTYTGESQKCLVHRSGQVVAESSLHPNWLEAWIRALIQGLLTVVS